MANESYKGGAFSGVAGADLSARQFTFVKYGTGGTLGKLVQASTGEAASGVLQNKPKSGQAATIWGVGGTSESKVLVGTGGLAVGDKVMSDSTGQAVLATSTNYILGECSVAALAGELGTVRLTVFGKA